jgi:hypothetical protein
MELAAAERCLINQHKYFPLANIGLYLEPYAENRLFHCQLFCSISTRYNNPDYTAVPTKENLTLVELGERILYQHLPPVLNPPHEESFRSPKGYFYQHLIHRRVN